MALHNVARFFQRIWFLILMILQRIIGVSRKKFFVSLAGKTNKSHHDFVKKLKGIGHTEVDSPEECDYLLAFCPIASRVGTDVGEALNKMPASKSTILVVMHHTFNPEHVVANSRRVVTNPNVFTVDCLFYDDHFLECKFNDAAWFEVQRHLQISVSQVLWRKCRDFFSCICCCKLWKVTIGCALSLALWLYWKILEYWNKEDK